MIDAAHPLRETLPVSIQACIEYQADRAEHQLCPGQLGLAIWSSGRLGARFAPRVQNVPTYLVTGGAGFIRTHVVHELVQRGDTVRVLDNISPGRIVNLASVSDRITLYEADICDLIHYS
jgi:hypothetical protein